jgi:hypothetical protein
MARISTLQPLNESSSSNSPREKAPVVVLRTSQSQTHDPVPVPLHLQSGEDLLRHFDELQTHPDWLITTSKWLLQISHDFYHRYVARVVKLAGNHKVVDHRNIIVNLARQHDEVRRLNRRQTKTSRELEIQMREHLASTRAVNVEYQLHLVELLSSTNTEFFTGLKKHSANEATTRHQDIAGLQAGLEELKTLQAQLAENSDRLFDYQRQTMRVSETILEA